VPASDGPAPGKQSAYGGLRGSGCVLFWLLNALNSAEPVLSDFLRYPSIHPELVWRELARLAGALLTFSLEHNVSAIPAYVHDAPSSVFPPLFTLLSELLEASLPSRVIALELESLPGNRWKAELHDPRLRKRRILPFCSLLAADARRSATVTTALQNRGAG
jgi:predicted component of type VI protein secretion system